MAGVRGQRSSGRNAKTARQHKLEGTFHKFRHAGIRNPDAPDGLPVSPEVLEGKALEEWDRMLALLWISKSVSVVDAPALYQVCRLFAETEAISGQQLEVSASVVILEENIHGLKGPDLVAVFQEISKMRQLEARYTTQLRQGRMAIRTYLVEFGLTPASRGRVRLPEKPDETDPFAEFDRPLRVVT